MRKVTPSKFLIRLAALIGTIALSILILLSILDPDPKAVEEFQKSNIILESLFSVLNMFGPLSIMALWIYTLYHWGTNQFISGFWKKLWLFLLLFANIFAAIIYYVLVFELRMTLKKDEDKVQEHG